MSKDRSASAESLPFPATPSASTAGRTMQESVYKRRVEPRRLPEDAPNILIVLIDDAGPGLPTTFGGEVQTRTADRIVGEGIGTHLAWLSAIDAPIAQWRLLAMWRRCISRTLVWTANRHSCKR
jgi:hypothetical protein